MKTYLLLILSMISIATIAQKKLITKTGKITFEASVPSFEEVKAKNENVTCIVNTDNGEIASLALIKGFRFKVALMEEHFNENYMESDRYPKAIFKGKIEDFDMAKLTSAGKDYTIKGKIEIHGKTKKINTIARIKKSSEGIDIDSQFVLNTDDFDIEIPKIVSNKVSKKVEVKLDFSLN